MDNGNVEIRFDGVRYGWWKRAEIRASVDDLCASLRLDVTLPGTGNNLGITANTLIDVLLDGETVYQMRLDSLSRSVSKDSHDIALSGRTLARELVDSQYSKTLSGLTLAGIAKQLCSDFKVPLKIAAATKEVPEFAMECESPATALINAARTANLLLYPLVDGGLILTEPTKTVLGTQLIYGENILDYDVTDEHALRFSEYCVKGYSHEENEAVSGRSRDKGITFYRPMHIVADKHGQGQGGCSRRAELERNRRQARAHRIEVSVQGWRYPVNDPWQAWGDSPDGRAHRLELMAQGWRPPALGTWRLWDVNTQVCVVIPPEGIDGVFLIGDRTFRLDDRGGHTTRLTLMRRDAFVGDGK